MDRDDEGRRRSANDAGSPAVGVALDAARGDPTLAEDARVFLHEQTRLVRLQAEQLIEEGRLMRWSLRLKHAGELMKFAFALAIAVVLTGIVVALGAAVWSAAHDRGLLIEAFSVPPDLAARGLGGEVVASQLLDRLTQMQEQTNSIRPASTYRNNWGDDIKVEIPDTGISIGELNRYLRSWLGHETHISGEIYRTASGIAVTTRAGGAGVTFAGKDSEFAALLQKAAESIYAQTQPYRYAAFLAQESRNDEAMRALENFAISAPPAERAWDYSLLGNLYRFFGRMPEALATLRAAVAADPQNAHAWDNLADQEQVLDRVEDVLAHRRKALSLFDSGSVEFDRNRVAIVRLQDRASVAQALGDFATAAQLDEAIREEPDQQGTQKQALTDEAAEAALAHDVRRADDLLAQVRPIGVNAHLNYEFTAGGIALADERWDALSKAIEPKAAIDSAPAAFRPVLTIIVSRLPAAWHAIASAMRGDMAAARRLIGPTPLDCYSCVRMRGRIDAAARNWAGAAAWFARAAREAPSVPDAFVDWGEMLLAKGDAQGAIYKLSEASRKAPRFADPLELWGEALMREDRSDLALSKFEAANPFAPEWGRLHLKWGEALSFVGRTGDAKAQFAIASSLVLDPADRAQLNTDRMH